MAQILQCELNIIKLTNLDIVDLPSGNLFIRYYVYAGGGRRIRINTREISCRSSLQWNETSTLQCQIPDPSSIKEEICARNIVFELRWRGSKPILGMLAKSKLLGTGEVGWEEMDLSVEKRVGFAMKKPISEGLKPPMLIVRMGITVRGLKLKEKRKVQNEKGLKDCRCSESCGWIRSEGDTFVASSMINAW